ncbi:MAG TPA: hypothetical protein VHJ18_23075 [Streptosporangiaceae bacterium]|jgi:hypothetical protein|nr:hypothetical protein [Streptosporangiaceae bacterium]
MQVTGIDPRDVQFEMDKPDYRVYFFESDGRSDEYQLTGARDVAEVLDWVKANVGDRTYIVYVFTDFGPGSDKPSLIRLLGRDPNEAPQS